MQTDRGLSLPNVLKIYQDRVRSLDTATIAQRHRLGHYLWVAASHMLPRVFWFPAAQAAKRPILLGTLADFMPLSSAIYISQFMCTLVQEEASHSCQCGFSLSAV